MPRPTQFGGHSIGGKRGYTPRQIKRIYPGSLRDTNPKAWRHKKRLRLITRESRRRNR